MQVCLAFCRVHPLQDFLRIFYEKNGMQSLQALTLHQAVAEGQRVGVVRSRALPTQRTLALRMLPWTKCATCSLASVARRLCIRLRTCPYVCQTLQEQAG